MTHHSTLSGLAAQFAADIGDSIDRYVEAQHPRTFGAWPGAIERNTNRRLRAAVAQMIVSKDESLRDLVEAYRLADDAIARCMSGGDDEVFAAKGKLEALERLAEDITTNLRGELEAIATPCVEGAA